MLMNPDHTPPEQACKLPRFQGQRRIPDRQPLKKSGRKENNGWARDTPMNRRLKNISG